MFESCRDHHYFHMTSYPFNIPRSFSSFPKTQASDMYAISIHMNLLAQILSSQVRAEIFRLLFNREKSSIYLPSLEFSVPLSLDHLRKAKKNPIATLISSSLETLVCVRFLQP